MANNESTKKVVTVAVLLCLFCSVIVSSAAVLLRPMQVANKALDFKRNVLNIASIEYTRNNLAEVYNERVEARVVDLESGKFVEDIDPASFDQERAARDSGSSVRLSSGEDLARIQRRENYSLVYLIKDEEGNFERLMLPIRGKGLWSTMYGLLTLESDLNTIAGIGFYDHGETPGLGGEIENPSWRAQWVGKEAFNEAGEPAITIVKGGADPDSAYQIDSLSGATLTANGVRDAVRFWLGEHGFKQFLINFENGEA